MTFVVEGDDGTVDQVTKQLYKLIDVVKVSDIYKEDVVLRELALVKVRTTPSTRPEVLQLVEIFRSSVVDVSPDSVRTPRGDRKRANGLGVVASRNSSLSHRLRSTFSMRAGVSSPLVR